MTATQTFPPHPLALRARLSAAWQRHRGWLWRDVVAVFLATRAALLLIAIIAQFFPTNSGYPDGGAAARGWGFTPVRLVDVWARWDSGWYFDLVRNGYYANGDIATVQSNLAYFPLYPYTVKALLSLLPATLRSYGMTVLVGVLVSNMCLVVGLALLHQWVTEITGDRQVARRTVLYLLLFPTGFIFSAFFAESTFLLCAAAALLAAHRRQWRWAGVAGALLTLTRPLGLLVAVPLAWEYAAAANWNVRKLRWDVLWLGLVPVAFLLYCYWQYTLTGDFLATIHTRQAWSRTFAWPWQTLLHPLAMAGITYMIPLEQILTGLFIAGSVAALWQLASPGLGVWALLMIAPPLFTGQLTSTARYYAVVLPVFIVAARLGRRPLVDRALTVLMAMTQAVLFFLWCRFYWVA